MWGFERQKLLESVEVPFKGACTQTYSDSLPLSSSTEAASWKTSEIYGRNWVGQHEDKIFLPERGHCSFSEPSPNRATQLVGRHHIWDSTNLVLTLCPTLVITWGSVPPNFQANPSCFQWLFYKNISSCPMLQIFLNYLKQAASGFRELHTSQWVSPGRPSSRSSQTWFTAWPHRGTPKPSTSNSHQQITL